MMKKGHKRVEKSLRMNCSLIINSQNTFSLCRSRFYKMEFFLLFCLGISFFFLSLFTRIFPFSLQFNTYRELPFTLASHKIINFHLKLQLYIVFTRET